MKYFFLIFISAIFIQSCGNETEDKKVITEDEKRKAKEETEFSKKVIGAEVKKGMYRYVANTGHFTECGTDKKYILAGEYETNEIKKAYQDKRNISPTGLVFLEIEGFQSVQDVDGNGVSDTVLVVTRFLKFDSSKECE